MKKDKQSKLDVNHDDFEAMMMAGLMADSNLEENKQTDCKGLIFRGYNNHFYDPESQRIESKWGIRLLKRKSCKGCPQCGFYFDDMNDMIDANSIIWPQQGIEDRKLYSIRIVNVKTDWESGHADNWDYEIYEVKE